MLLASDPPNEINKKKTCVFETRRYVASLYARKQAVYYGYFYSYFWLTIMQMRCKYIDNKSIEIEEISEPNVIRTYV